MEPASPLSHLTTVVGSFHGRVVAARLRAEGLHAELRGASDGPYPFPGEVDVLVPADQLELAREILLADAVEAVFEPPGAPAGGRRRAARRRSLRRPRLRRPEGR